jgi:hypothetical protein
MTMYRASYLLQLFLSLLSARGLAAETVDAWRGWLTFKQYVRIAREIPDPGISVQIYPERTSDEVRLIFLRQVVEPDGDWLEPVGGVVCELTFVEPDVRVSPFAFWSFDYGTFERFVDVVEQTPAFADLMARRPARSAVYWQDAAGGPPAPDAAA